MRTLIGQSSHVDLPELGALGVAARIDTGARTTALWASEISADSTGLHFVLFDRNSRYYTGKQLHVAQYELRDVTSSSGHTETRYMIQTLLIIDGRRIRARVTLTDRSAQSYPMLIGRNVLKGKFIVDVKHERVPVPAPRKGASQ